MIKGLRKGLHRKALEAIVSHLQSHPVVGNGRMIKTWFTWDGKAAVEPPVDMMPCLQARLVGGPAKRIASRRAPGGPMLHTIQESPQLVIDLVTPGPDQFQLLDLGELVFDALFPQDPAERAALEARLRSAGIADWELQRPIMPPSAESFDAAYVAGQGVVALTLHVLS